MFVAKNLFSFRKITRFYPDFDLIFNSLTSIPEKFQRKWT